MNYISQLNAFYDWQETNPTTTSEVALYMALLNVNNKARWISEFSVAASTLESKSGLKRRSVERIRKDLEEKGLIKWRSRSGNQAASYSIVRLYDAPSDVQTEFVRHGDADSVVQPESVRHSDASSDVQTDVVRHSGAGSDVQTEFVRHDDASSDAINKQNNNISFYINSDDRHIEVPGKNLYCELVYLSDQEYNQLVVEYGETITKQLIVDLNNYMGQIGVIEAAEKYKSHFFAIKGFRERQKKTKPKTNVQELRPKNKFHNHDQRNYDFATIESKMNDKLEQDLEESNAERSTSVTGVSP